MRARHFVYPADKISYEDSDRACDYITDYYKWKERKSNTKITTYAAGFAAFNTLRRAVSFMNRAHYETGVPFVVECRYGHKCKKFYGSVPRK